MRLEGSALYVSLGEAGAGIVTDEKVMPSRVSDYSDKEGSWEAGQGLAGTAPHSPCPS